MQSFLGATKQAYSVSEGTSLGNWCDWSSRSVNCTGLPGHVTNRIPNADTFHRQNVSVSYQNIPNQMSLDYDDNSGTTNFLPYSNDNLRRNNSCSDTSVVKRKLHDISTAQNRQFDDFCSFNVGSNLL